MNSEKNSSSTKTSPTGVWMWERTWPQIEEYLASKSTVLLPVGSTEQHGKHLPLGVDALVAIRLAEDVAEQSGVLVAPPIWYGYAPHHMAKPGTVTLRATTLIDLVEDAVSSLIYHGFKNVVIINGHRVTNLPPLQIAASNVRNRTNAMVTIVDPVYAGMALIRDLLDEGDSGGQGHADGLETAQMLHLYPDLVDHEHLKATEAASAQSPAVPDLHNWDPFHAIDHVIYAETADDVGEVGGAGRPSWGTPERGQRLHEGLVGNLVTYVGQMEMIEHTNIERGNIPL